MWNHSYLMPLLFRIKSRVTICQKSSADPEKIRLRDIKSSGLRCHPTVGGRRPPQNIQHEHDEPRPLLFVKDFQQIYLIVKRKNTTTQGLSFACLLLCSGHNQVSWIFCYSAQAFGTRVHPLRNMAICSGNHRRLEEIASDQH